GSKYVELGATVSDPNDPKLKVSIDSSAVKTNVTGSYSVEYNAVDPAGNHAVQVIRTVDVVDTSISNAKITITIKTLSVSPVSGATYTISPNPKTGFGSLTITDGGADDEDGLANGAIEISHVHKGKYVITQMNIPPGFRSLLKSTITNVHSSSLNKIVNFHVLPTSTDLTQLPSQSIQSPSLNNKTFNSWTSSSFSAKLIDNDNSSVIINNVEQTPQLIIAGSGNSSAINSSLISEQSVLLNASFAPLTSGSKIVNTIGLENYSLPNSTNVVAIIPTIVTHVNTTSGYIAATPPISGVIPGQEMIIPVADPLIPSFGGLKEITVQSSTVQQPVEVNNTNWFVAEVENAIPFALTSNGINSAPVLFINIQHPFEENQTAFNWSNASNLAVPPTLTIIVSKTNSSSVLNDAQDCPIIIPYTLVSNSWTTFGVNETSSKSISVSQCEITIESQHLSKFAFSLQHLSSLTSSVGLSGTGAASSGSDNHPSTSNFASAISSPNNTTPSIPTGVTTTAISSNQIRVSWTASPGATTYNIYRATSQTGPFTMIGSTAATSYTNGGLSAGTTYYYKISTANNTDTPTQSSLASATSTYTVKPVTPSTSTSVTKPVTPSTSTSVTKSTSKSSTNTLRK
ncbi:MAG TPA: immunoglobulin-like domain-containing protein, partial [Nitrosopumilaceae archaeon]|nr:immunoglobulin-like domain-containing protein [Nitrosopumilaceae archaeon]